MSKPLPEVQFSPGEWTQEQQVAAIAKWLAEYFVHGLEDEAETLSQSEEEPITAANLFQDLLEAADKPFYLATEPVEQAITELMRAKYPDQWE